MTQIFISYAREDREFVNELTARLGENGYGTRIDSEDIRLGKDWRHEIDNGIQKSDAVIVVMTPRAKKSEYVTYEWAYGLGVKKDVITILLKNTTLHSRLQALQYVDSREERRWEDFFRGLEKAIGAFKAANTEEQKKEPPVRFVPTKGLYLSQRTETKDKPRS